MKGALTAALLLAVLSVGCGEDEERTFVGHGPVVAHAEKGDGSGDLALISGPLALTDGCLTVHGYPVIWPYGTTWDADAESVVLPEGTVAAVGDEVSGGGGFHSLPDLDPGLADLERLPVRQDGGSRAVQRLRGRRGRLGTT